jgi:endonuclease-3
MKKEINWPEAIKPLLKKYKNKPHPLEAENLYQMLVMVVLSAQTTDNIINQIAPEFFKAYPNMQSLSNASVETLSPFISKSRGFLKKGKWLIAIAKELKKDSNIPLNLQQLTDLPGIGRKSANVIMRYAKAPAEGVVVDLHVVRVAPRLGIATGDDPTKIEKQIMEILPQKEWDAGMAMSFLGREICRPEPECEICLMNRVCAYYNGWLNISDGN